MGPDGRPLLLLLTINRCGCQAALCHRVAMAPGREAHSSGSSRLGLINVSPATGTFARLGDVSSQPFRQPCQQSNQSMKGLGRVVIGSAVGGLLSAAAFFAVEMQPAKSIEKPTFPSFAALSKGSDCKIILDFPERRLLRQKSRCKFGS